MTRLNPFVPAPPRVSVVRMQGAIGLGGRGIDDTTLAPLLEKAFRSKPKAVALQINSPGGSAVQSSLIGARIRRLSEEHGVPVHAFVEDVAASGGYWLACAADDIYLDASSVVGSIGVISAGFGLQDLIGRYGVERRVHTAGKSKSFMDPFKPEKPEDVARLNEILEQIHETFIAHVKARRGDRLADNPDLFTGEVRVGQRAVDEGLADAIGHLVPVMKEKYGKKVEFRRYAPRRSLFRRLGAETAEAALAEADERLLLGRFDLR